MDGRRLRILLLFQTAMALVLLSLIVPWTNGGPDSTRVMWNRWEEPQQDGRREAIYFFSDVRAIETQPLLQKIVIAFLGSVALLFVLSAWVALELSGVIGHSRATRYLAILGGIPLLVMPLNWGAADVGGSGTGPTLCFFAGVLMLVAAGAWGSGQKSPDVAGTPTQ